MGGEWLPTLCLLTSVLLALALMHQLATIAMTGGSPRNVKLAALLLVGTITLMSATLVLARGDAFSRSALPPKLPRAGVASVLAEAPSTFTTVARQ